MQKSSLPPTSSKVRLGLAAACAVSICAARANASLVGYWAFDEASGQTVADSSGQGNNGVLGATNSTESTDPTHSAPGKVGAGSLTFDPANVQRVTVPSAASLNIGGAGGSDQLTISAWVNVPDRNGYFGIIGKTPSNGSGSNFPGNYELRIDNTTGVLNFLFEPNGAAPGNVTGAVSSSAVPVGGYHHVAVTVSESSVTSTAINFYIDGVAAGSGIAPANFGATNNNPLLIGSRADLFTNFKGSMDEVGLWSDALATSSILGLANGTYTPLTAPVPEPTSLALIGVASAALLSRSRRRCR